MTAPYHPDRCSQIDTPSHGGVIRWPILYLILIFPKSLYHRSLYHYTIGIGIVNRKTLRNLPKSLYSNNLGRRLFYRYFSFGTAGAAPFGHKSLCSNDLRRVYPKKNPAPQRMRLTGNGATGRACLGTVGHFQSGV